MTTRFPAELPYDASHHLLEVYSAMVAGEWGEVKARFASNPQAVSDAAGAIRYWRDKYTPAAPMIIGSIAGGNPLVLYQPRDFTSPTLVPGVILAIQAASASVQGVSNSVGSGGVAIYGGVADAPGDPMSFPTAHQSYGVGATSPRLPIRIGQWYCFRLAPDGVQAQTWYRVSME